MNATRKERALWVLEKLVPDSGVNNLTFTFQVEGRLDPGSLNAAVAVMLRRYEVLRTVYRVEGGELTRRTVPDLAVTVERVASVAGDPHKDLAEFAGRPFALDGEPLLRVALLDDPEGDVVCVLAHHLIFDFFSSGVFMY